MLFKLISDGKHTALELDGKSLGRDVKRIVFKHDAEGGGDGHGNVELTLTFNLSEVYRSEQAGGKPGIAEENGRFDETASCFERREKELYDEYNSTKQQREELRKALLDDKPRLQ